MTNKKLILVFDDNPENLRVAKQAYDKLDEYGFSVETTPNPDDALDRIQRGNADVLVTDLYSPREMVSPRILSKWEGLVDDAVKYFEGGRKKGEKNYGYIVTDRFASFKTRRQSEGYFWFKHPQWKGVIEVPPFYPGSTSIKNLMLMKPSAEQKKQILMNYWGSLYFDANPQYADDLDLKFPCRIGKNFTFEEFKKVNPDMDEAVLRRRFDRYQVEYPSYLKKLNSSQKNVPVGVVLYAVAQEKGIPANIVSDTHRHALEGVHDIKGVVLPLLVEDPSLVILRDSKKDGDIDPSRIRTNARKKEVSSWYYGGGYEMASASFLPEELRSLYGKNLEDRLDI
jgi:CheY-like chemotaxis protein